MKLSIKGGTTSKLLDIFIQDSSSTTGAGLTGLVFNSAGLTAYYYREGAATSTAITLATMTLGTWATGGFVVIDGTNMPGCYQLGIPDAALATGAKSVLVMLKGATNMAPLVLEVELTGWDNQDAVHGGMSALPNASAGASGGVPTVDAANGVKVSVGTGAGQINAASGKVPATLASTDVTGNVASDLQTIKTQTVTCAGGVTVPAATLASTTNITAATGITVATNNDKTGYRTIWEIRNGTAQAGAATSITLDASASATNNLYDGAWIVLTGGTGAGQINLITAYNGTTKVATVASTWATTPDATSVFTILPASTVLGVNGNVTGSVASVTGAVGSVTGGVTVTTNNDKTGYAIGTGGISTTSFAANAIDSTTVTVAFNNGIAAAVGGRVAESAGSYTYDQVLRILLSALAGVTATNGAVLKTPDGTATRITATIDANNNRTSMVLSP